MIELTADNALDYLRRQGWLGEGPAWAESLGGGVSNQVLRISGPDRCFVLKQSRPQLRTKDAWFSDLERIYREQEVMQALHPHLPTVVPEVHFVDRPNFVYAMSHAPLDATVWKADLLAGRINAKFGMQVGQVLGRIHRISVQEASRFEAFRDHNVFVQLRVDPFYRRVQERRREFAAVLETIIHDMLTVKEALCHGDYTPKNMLVHAGAFTLVDYETAHFGDPTMDLGLLLAHLTLKAVHAPERRDEIFALIDCFWTGYRQALAPLPHEEWQRRGMRHLGACLLARVDGTSPVDYLPDESKRQIVRKLARAILLDGIGEWQQVRQCCERELPH